MSWPDQRNTLLNSFSLQVSPNLAYSALPFSLNYAQSWLSFQWATLDPFLSSWISQLSYVSLAIIHLLKLSSLLPSSKDRQHFSAFVFGLWVFILLILWSSPQFQLIFSRIFTQSNLPLNKWGHLERQVSVIEARESVSHNKRHCCSHHQLFLLEPDSEIYSSQ